MSVGILRHALVLAWAAMLAHGATATNCSAPPLLIPLQNTTLADLQVRRGLSMAIGTPAQDFSLMPSLLYSNILLRQSPGMCESGWSPEHCTTDQGGLFDTRLSSTYHPITLKDFIAAADDTQSFSTFYQGQTDRVYPGTDVLNVSNVSLPNYTFASVTNPDNFTVDILGMGPNSSLIDGLYNSGNVPAKTWGYWYGQTGDQNWMDGSLVVGGYDEKKVKGEVDMKFAMSTDMSNVCQLPVVLTGVKLNFENGTSTSIMDTGTTRLAACITPESPVLRFPDDMLHRFVAASGVNYTESWQMQGFGFFYWGFVINGGTPFTGNMTISIDGAPDITIPSHELIQPDRGYDESGRWVIQSKKMIGMIDDTARTMTYEPTIPKEFALGGPFLSAAYLTVDPVKQRFAINEAVATKEKSIVSFAANDTSCARIVGASKNNVNGSAADNSELDSSKHDNASPKKSSNTGKIVGGIIAGVAALALLAGLAWFFLRRKSASAELPSTPTTPQEMEGATAYYPHNYPQEMDQAYTADPHKVGPAAHAQWRPPPTNELP